MDKISLLNLTWSYCSFGHFVYSFWWEARFAFALKYARDSYS